MHPCLDEGARRALHPSRTPPRTRLEETMIDLWEAAPSLDDAVGWVTSASAVGSPRKTSCGMRWQRASACAGDRSWPSCSARTRQAFTRCLNTATFAMSSDRTACRQSAGRRLRGGDGRAEYRDTLYEEYSTAIELDGTGRASRRQSLDRHPARQRGIVAGITTLRYGWRDVTLTPCTLRPRSLRSWPSGAITVPGLARRLPGRPLGPAEQPAGSPARPRAQETLSGPGQRGQLHQDQGHQNLDRKAVAQPAADRAAGRSAADKTPGRSADRAPGSSADRAPGRSAAEASWRPTGQSRPRLRCRSPAAADARPSPKYLSAMQSGR